MRQPGTERLKSRGRAASPGAGPRVGLRRIGANLAAALVCLLIAGCDGPRIDRLEEGVATEDDVRRQFGEPLATYAEADGGHTLEYPRQPEGRSNLMITIGSNGRMSALRQVLTEANFARVTPGMRQDEVRRLLGRPATTQRYQPAREEAWDWRFGSNADKKVFSVVFDFDGIVLRSAITIDPRELYTGG